MAILACADREVLALRVRWDAACAVSIEPRHEDPLVTECVEAALGELPRRCEGDGELLHVVRSEAD